MRKGEMIRHVPEQIRGALHGMVGVALEDLAWSIGLIAAAVVIGRLVAALLLRSARHWAKTTETVAHDVVVEKLRPPLRALLPAIFVALVLPWLPLRSIPFEHAVLVAIIASAGWTAFRLLLVVEAHLTRNYDIDHASDVRARARYTRLRGFRNIGSFVIILVTISFAMMTFDAVRSIGTGLLASAGVAGIVLGFAAQKTIATLFAGVQIAVAQPIRVGDIVVVEGEQGTVEEIALTYVVLRIWDFRRLVVPVQYFIDKPFQNWTRGETKLRGTVELRFDYSISIDTLRTELARVLQSSKFWDQEANDVQVAEAGEKTMLLRLIVSAKDADDLSSLRCEVREKLVTFVQANFPSALPKVRADVSEKRAA